MSRFSRWGVRHEEHMQHLEESTIHAWLDEALSSEESARVEAHVQECGECAAMVADARGLIAGASRIVSALDIVPGGVLPKPAPVVPAPGKSLWRSLHLTPFRAALAASLMLAVASLFAVRGSYRQASVATSEQKAVAPTPMAPMAARPTAVASPAIPSATRPIASADAGPVSRERAQLRSVPVMKANEAPTEKALAAPKVLPPPRAFAAADSTMRADSTRRTVAVDSTARAVADARAAAATPAAPPAAVNRADSVAARRPSEVAASAAGAGRGGRGGQNQAQARMAMEVPRRALLSDNSFASDFAGCYKVSDSTSWPRTLPTQFLLVRDSTAAGTRYVRLVRDGRVDTSVVGNWQPTGPGTALVSFNGTTPARFSFTQGPGGVLLAQIQQNGQRQAIGGQPLGALVLRMSCP